MYSVADLQPGDLILLHSERPHAPPLTRLLDALIDWSTASHWHHACLVGDGHLLNPLWHVEEAPLDLYAQVGWHFSVAGATNIMRAKAVAWAEERVGQRYGIEEIALDAAKFDLHWTPRLHHRLTRLTCSGFVAAAWASAGITLTYAEWPAPSDLAASPLLVGPRP